MNCPKCGSALKPFQVKNVELDKCVKCHGIWFDEGELKKISEMNLSEEELKEISDKKVEIKTEEKKGSNLCPRCANPLQEINYMYETNIKVDSCPVCNGVWLDWGELIQIIKYVSEHSSLKNEEKEKYLEIYQKAKAQTDKFSKETTNAFLKNALHDGILLKFIKKITKPFHK